MTMKMMMMMKIPLAFLNQSKKKPEKELEKKGLKKRKTWIKIIIKLDEIKDLLNEICANISQMEFASNEINVLIVI